MSRTWPAENRIFALGKVRDEWLPVNAEAMTVFLRMAGRLGNEGHLASMAASKRVNPAV